MPVVDTYPRRLLRPIIPNKLISPTNSHSNAQEYVITTDDDTKSREFWCVAKRVDPLALPQQWMPLFLGDQQALPSQHGAALCRQFRGQGCLAFGVKRQCLLVAKY